MILDYLEIEKFKSIKKLELRLKRINVLIGPNGAGKSNFIQFFNLLNNLVLQNLQNYVAMNGGADSLLYFGRKHSESFSGFLSFGRNAYQFDLTSTNENNFYFSRELTIYQNPVHGGVSRRNISSGNKESNLFRQRDNVTEHIVKAMTTWDVYHFHDTSSSSKLKQDSNINDNRSLRKDASNLASFLYLLQQKEPEYLIRIENTIRLIAPFFEKFLLQPLALNQEKIRLEWKQIGSDQYFNANHFSDGTLRMICLITLLLQPNLPDTIIIDEPELGLHPAAIELLSSLLKTVTSNKKQVICSTQSVTFLNHFEPEDIIVVDRINDESEFKRLDKSNLTEWLNEYAIGELWEKNILGGRP